MTDKASSPQARPQKPTLKTIAQVSGMAVPTVSRALADAPDISETTKERIRRIANELGYIPNRAGVGLRTGRTNVVSLVMSAEREMMNVTARLLSSIGVSLRATPFHLNVVPVLPDDDPMQAVRYIVENRTADGIIFNQVRTEDPRAQFLMERKFPFATHGRTKWAGQHAYYDFDNFTYARLGVDELVRKGRKNLILVAPPIEHNYALEMVEGAQKAAAAHGVKLHVAKQVDSDATTLETRDWATRKMTSDPNIDGIICASTSATMAVVAGMESTGRKVGHDFDVVAKEAIPMLQLMRPEIIVVNENVDITGAFLADAIVQAIRTPENAPLQCLEVPNKDALHSL
ncbi:transcriptional regulator, LacI family [Aliiroseovarius halocynthiae]|uniref:LacI family DNA-binding transcriptional regulator n=1 Tax=Aliiroseovarius halocynthiae TaxID=985055 RepID=A0A545SUK8_9RHOB|nr:LacI family transcriptional regulator [Aliiroseovarius halocynthiae]TQV68632.1 LacI family DNA-binding transcriptional regulator [Aliiroseovarius halocynthiae]SMR71050.1 transcriptional regulator, LacI family [Aliiroseovarius halocynthiae]